MPHATVEQIVELARRLSPVERLTLIEQLTSESDKTPLDDEYQRGYEKLPEDTTDVEALLPHLPLPREQWE